MNRAAAGWEKEKRKKNAPDSKLRFEDEATDEESKGSG
jgi:hypothetical protein